MNKLDSFIHEDGRLKTRVIKILKWSEEETVNVLKAYKEFLELKIALKDWNATILLPSLQVKKVWELHVLDTRRYTQSCKTLFWNTIHYDPDGEPNPTRRKERIEKTKLVYQARFSVKPTGVIWQFEHPHVSANLHNLCDDEKESTEVVLYIENLESKITSISIDLNATVEELKEMYESVEGFPADRQMLLYKYKKLEDGRRLVDHNIQKESKIQVIAILRGC